MELNEMEKRLLFQVEDDYQSKVLNDLHMTTSYTKNLEQRETTESLMAKLHIPTVICPFFRDVHHCLVQQLKS